MMKRALIFIILLLIIPFTLAHLDAGEDTTVDGYEIDFGYSPSEIDSETKALLSFNLLNETTKETIEFDSL